MTTQETAILTYHTFRMLGFDNLLLLIYFLKYTFLLCWTHRIYYSYLFEL